MTTRGRYNVPPFWDRVDKTGDCWVWTWGTSGGYGTYRYDGKIHRAHRWAWQQTHGPIPEGMQLDHLCRNTRCVRPDHLEVVDHRTNVLRGIGPTAVNARKTVCQRGHELTPKADGSGRRECRTCSQATKSAWQKRHAA